MLDVRRRRWILGTSVLAALLVAPVAGAEEAAQPPSFEKLDEGMDFGSVLVRTVVVLGIVLGAIYLTLNFGLRKLMRAQGLAAGRSSVVTVIERLPLDPKRTLFVVKAAGEYLLLGAGEGAVSLLSKLDAQEVERLQREKASTPFSPSPFLQKLLSRRRGTPPSA